MTPMSPSEVLQQVAEALPESCRPNVIMIGSLAAGYYFFAGDGHRTIRTKDIDCMFSPYAKAVGAAEQVTEELFSAQWQQRPGDWSVPGDEGTPEGQLPLVRLMPPGERGGADWFLELLGAPDVSSGDLPAKQNHRLKTSRGHFTLCSFRYLAVTEWSPCSTPYGVRVARPEMMALANLLHHPVIAPDRIGNTNWKRSNKDLGRVIALAWLAIEQDRRSDTENFGQWAEHMAAALTEKFPQQAPALARQAGSGLRALLASEADMAQALHIANLGLLASLDVGGPGFAAVGRRVLQDVIEPLES